MADEWMYEASCIRIDDIISMLEEPQNLQIIRKNYMDYLDYYDGEFFVGLEKNEEGFLELLQTDINLLREQRQLIDEYAKIEFSEESKINSLLQSKYYECLNEVRDIEYSVDDIYLLYNIRFLETRMDALKALKMLLRLRDINSNIVIVGGNGSGKSSFANRLKGNDMNSMSVIPAQKTLFYTVNDKSMLTTRRKDVMDILLQNHIESSKSSTDYEYFRFQNNQFTKLILALKDDLVSYMLECREKEQIAEKNKGIFGQLQELFQYLFLDLELDINTDVEMGIRCKRGDSEYQINALSEGEKAVIYYAISVFVAKENSIIVVDEPETYLNPGLSNLLWDYLVQHREDCQFVFITHSVDFLMARNDSRIAWIKKYEYPDKWEIELLEDDIDMPRTLMTEILGSRKGIVFCEGTKASLDYEIYRAVLGEKYTVIPSGGHTEVIEYAKSLNKNEWLSIDAMGIVDGDWWSEEKGEKLKKSNIKVLPINEIEMLLFDEDVMNLVLKHIYPEDYQKRIKDFKNEFWERVKKSKDKIVCTGVLNAVNEYIENERIRECKDKDSIEANLQTIGSFDVNALYTRKNDEIEKMIETRDYNKLLAVCSLKKEISVDVANRYLDSNYMVKAKQRIKHDKELQERIREKYLGGE